MNIFKALPELLQAGVITPETDARIREYYAQKKAGSANRLNIVFGILGALLVGAGLMLIIAHNWDQLGKLPKVIIAFTPLVVGQACGAFTLWKRPDSVAWREGVGVFLVMAIGLCLSLIAQIFQLPEEMDVLLLKWALLALPVMYVLRSSVASLVYLSLIGYWLITVGFEWRNPTEPNYFWLLLLAALPYYLWQVATKPNSNFVSILHWAWAIMLPFGLTAAIGERGYLIVPAFFSTFGLIYTLGGRPWFANDRESKLGMQVVGILGMLGLMIAFSFHGLWEEVSNESSYHQTVQLGSETIAAVLASVFAVGMAILNQFKRGTSGFRLMEWLPVAFLITWLIGLQTPMAAVLVNILLLGIGIYLIVNGAHADSLSILNGGLAIISILILCRFFDVDISFMLRGIVFLALGGAFFGTNYWVIQRRKKHA